jgi:hypothetical protein
MPLFRSEILGELWQEFPASSKPFQQCSHPTLICSDSRFSAALFDFYADGLDLARHIDADFLRGLTPIDSPDPVNFRDQWSGSDLLVQPLEEIHCKSQDCC